MGCHNLVLIIFIYLCCFSNLLITIKYTSAQDSTQLCSGNNYTAGSIFEANLNLVFPATISKRYYNATVGQSPGTIYGSVQCRGDVTLDACQSCVQMGAPKIIEKGRCSNFKQNSSKQSIIWYDRCMLRYSNEYYFNIMQDSPEVRRWDVTNVSNPDQFVGGILLQYYSNLINDLVGEAACSFSANFATGDRNITNRTKVYGFVECAADVPSRNCSKCLFGVISNLPSCCDGKIGGRILRPSCNIRYEIYPFLQSMNAPPSPPLLSSPAPLASLPPLSSTSLNSSFKPAMLVIIIVVVSFMGEKQI
ncbi:cysteine-rich repeat secretory protein 38-like [Papaver somniferum]|uniref:cysteine-rich repeat secretory protein 38-like n=1 Tax=Papaver somniferum TaxID=3469 RepID=UPI000E6F60BD|nr:cysteine-rich repeat secretory protein 38-like [Papaver somniferum]